MIHKGGLRVKAVLGEYPACIIRQVGNHHSNRLAKRTIHLKYQMLDTRLSLATALDRLSLLVSMQTVKKTCTCTF
jgi:hypothetical protein